MRLHIQECYGDAALDTFKASSKWMFNFKGRFGLAWRRKNNKKNVDLKDRLAKIRLWHARLRRRQKRQPCLGTVYHPKYGRWLPPYTINVDQVPCNLREGSDVTLDFRNANRVWVAGAGRGDDTKRFCTLQLAVRLDNGDETQLYCGQPMPEICFRGTGLKISDEEKRAYAAGVSVVFQPKAWYDRGLCVGWVGRVLKAATTLARASGHESVVMCDNLDGQTTSDFKYALREQKTVLHLLPSKH